MAKKFNVLDLVKLEKIEAFVKAPWVPPVRVNIFDRKEAIQKAKVFNPREPLLFTDGSVGNGVVGIGVKWMGSLYWPDVSKTVSTSQQLDPYAAELIALDSAVSVLLTSMQRGNTRPPVTIFSDCKSALQALSNPYPRSGQFLITRITLKVHEINMFQQLQINFQWSPGHSEISGNEQAHKLAQDATTIASARTDDCSQYLLLQSVALEKGQRLYLTPPSPWTKPAIGKFTHRIDKVLPGKHTEKLHKRRSRLEASVLCQLRSGMCRLNGYLAKIGAVETDICKYGCESESVDHFLFRCPKWLEQLKTLFNLARKAHRCSDLSFALGGTGQTKEKMEHYRAGSRPKKWFRLLLNLQSPLIG